MLKKETLIVTAITSALALGSLSMANLAGAEESMEHCYGVVKAGKNDCAGPGHTCQGQAKSDSDPKEFILLPGGTCERLTGGEVR